LGLLRRFALQSLPALAVIALALVLGGAPADTLLSQFAALAAGVVVACAPLLHWYSSRERVLEQLAFELRRSELAQQLGTKPGELAYFPLRRTSQ
jgi:hypothetical protein